MRIQIVTPMTSISRTGNRGTANQWAAMLRDAGYEVEVAPPGAECEGVEVMIALHGAKSRESVDVCREMGVGKLVVGFTGTDIYPEPDEVVLSSMELADRLIILQEKALEKIPERFREKVLVIPQSAKPAPNPGMFDPDYFDICVVGHLRDVKDPMRAAEAARLLPEDSQIRILHAGGILEDHYSALVEREMSENRRYRYLGELGEDDTADLIGSSRALVLSSFSEGGARVAGEAFVNSTPVISSRIDGVIGLVESETYPGFFPFGDTKALAGLMNRLETDPGYRDEMKQWAETLAPKFDPGYEQALLVGMIEDLRKS